MEKPVTLDPPGTEKRCKLMERALTGSWGALASKGDSNIWGDEVVALC